MRFSEFARALEALENTASRLQMYELLGGLFDRAEDEEVAPASYLLEGRLLPAFEGVETGVGERNAALALADEITRSPIHTAALDGQGRGLALRFPRVVGFIRDDKSSPETVLRPMPAASQKAPPILSLLLRAECRCFPKSARHAAGMTFERSCMLTVWRVCHIF